MDGFKNSTKTQYMKGGACEGYAKGGSVKGAAKINKVMGEFKRGELHSGSKKGAEVTNPKQAVAIALSEARKAGAKIPVKKADGGAIVQTPAARAARAAGLTQAANAAANVVAQRKAAAQANDARLAQIRAHDAARKQALAQAMANRDANAARGLAENQRVMQAAQARANAAKAAPQTFVRTQGPGGAFGTPVARKEGGAVKKSDGGAVARGNRMSALEAREEQKLMREAKDSTKTGPRSREFTTERRATMQRDVREPIIGNSLMDRLSRLPSERGEMPIRRKGGGLAVMPRGKKC